MNTRKLKAKPELLKVIIGNGYTSKDMCEMCGVAQQTISNVMCCRNVSPHTARKVCDVLDIEFWDYFELIED